MIKREDIKEGLLFTLPNYRFESKEDEMKYNHRLVNGGSDYIPNPPCYTDIYHGESKTTLKTSYTPTFEVIGAKTMSKMGGIYTANCKCLESGKSIFVNISYIESCGKVVEPEKNDKGKNVEHPPYYVWLKELCGIEPLDICRHLNFNTGNAIKYLLRKDKVDGNKTKTEKRIEDLRKAIFYINDEIKKINERDLEKHNR